MSSYYQTLGIAAGADKKEIKKAYFKLLRTYSPEKNPTEFKKIREAYEYLMQDNNRKREETKAQIDPAFQQAYAQVLAYRDEEEYEMGIACCLEVLQISEIEAFRFLLAKLYRDNENTGKEVKEFEILVKKFPKNKEYLFHLGSAYCHREWWKKGLAVFERLEQEQYQSLNYYDDYGYCLMKRGFYQKSREILLQGIDFFSQMEKEEQKKYMEQVGFIWCVLLECDCEIEYSVMEKDLNAYLSFLELHSEAQYALRQISLNVLDKAISKADESSVLRSLAKILYHRIQELEENYKLEEELLKMLRAMGGYLECQCLKEDERIPEELKEDADNLYRNIIIEKVNIKEEDYMERLLDPDWEEYQIAMLDLKLTLLDSWDRAKQWLLLLREEYPLYAEAFGDFVEEVLQSSSKTYLWRKYEKQFKKLMGYPSSGHLVKSEKDPLIFDSSDGDTYRRTEPKIGRNDPCPCGSGKKYKNCCGKN
ncbi:MAG: DnaJ domain-containing protein [Lachnospiraceae bacterium]|nr:DnaJ domain-containing protein [Lachnospiraceae bacterium]